MADQSPAGKQTLVQLVQKYLNESEDGFIEREQFLTFCGDLSVSSDELENVFKELDGDGDGRINVVDFTSSYDQVSSMFAKAGSSNVNRNVNRSANRSTFECEVNGLESPMQVMAGQQYISELYYNLANSNQPDLVELFEKHLASVVKDIKARANENQRLEEALKRATIQHARQVSNLDNEMEQQMEKLEAKVREEEKILFDKKLSDLRWQLESKDGEISTMGKAIETLQGRLYKETEKPSRKDEIEGICQENRFLKSQVTDSQTALALLRSELAELRSEFVEQSEVLKKEQRTLHDSLQEQENLTRQLQLLHEANQRLHDINDELRGALELKRKTSSPLRTTGDVMMLSGIFSDPGLHSSKPMRCRSGTPTKLGGIGDHQLVNGCEESLNEDSLFSEIHRASTKMDVDKQTLNDLLTINNATTTDKNDTETSSSHDSPVYSPCFGGNDHNLNLFKSNSIDCIVTGPPRIKNPKFNNNILGRIMTELSLRNNKFNNAIQSQEQKNKLFPIFQKHPIMENEIRKTVCVHSSQERHGEFLESANDKISTKICPKEDEFVLDKYFTETRRKICEKVDSCFMNENLISAKNETDDENFHKKSAENDVEISNDQPSDLVGQTDLSMDLNTESLKELSAVSVKLDDMKFDSVECTYEQFEKTLSIKNASGYVYSSPMDSLDSETKSNSDFVEPYKSDVDEDEAYGTMAKDKNNHVQKQIQILEETNQRLSSSNDELRVALKLMSRSGSFRKPKKPPGVRRSASFNSDYGSLSSRSSRSFSPKQKRASTDVGEATDESTTYDVEDDDIVATASDSTTMNSENVADSESQIKEDSAKAKEHKNNQVNDHEEEEDEDEDVNSEELAELVAMASDMSDNSASDSESDEETVRCRRRDSLNNSFDREEMSTMTNDSQASNYGTPERMYKLVLAGDAAVGKSSFILRLCRNKFHNNLNATLGVDFQVKNIKVDSKTVALQLWDTAGQERFRSIAKSYFRKVDGVLLLYDVTCESSFINIRDWMQTIEESSQKKVPIMLCGNKCDLREDFAQEGKKVITRENGERLASTYNALFLETSAKDGKHINEACKQLARILTSIENEEIEQSGLKLDKRDREKKKRACCSS